MSVESIKLTELERRRVSDLTAVALTELSSRPCPLHSALEKDGVAVERVLDSLHFKLFQPWTHPPDALGRWLARQPAAARRRAGRWTIGHLLPGNHPGAVISALLPGWLLGCRQIVRPSPRLKHFTRALVKQVQRYTAGGPKPGDLRYYGNEHILAYDPRFDGRTRLPAQEVRAWDHRRAGSARKLAQFLRDCDVVTVQGSDFTVAAIEAAWASLPARERPRLIAFPNRVSLVAIDCDALRPRAALGTRNPDTGRVHRWPGVTQARLVVQHIGMGDQRGCLDPHGILLVGSPRARGAWRRALGAEFAQARLGWGKTPQPVCRPQAAKFRLDFAQLHPAPLTPEEQLAAAYQHRVYAALAAQGDSEYTAQAFGPRGTKARLWRVPLTEPPLALTGHCYSLWEADSPRVAAAAIQRWNVALQAIGCVPGPAQFARAFSGLGCWVCNIAELQQPPVDWPQDGCDLLTRLMRLAEMPPHA